ncbi:UDP-glycosyltransferase 73C11-like [Cornus florida]|uniref:UDP-glycosyltransferase 73C11-like n=2 Tax=Cornus florida TaxID=4283 RepID=UPI002898DEDA|nr:UDP-glycosyltransferase 73C11-like [Cornus florida]
MASQPHHLHFVLIPLMAQGHLIPMVDMAKLLAQRGIVVTIVTTPLNAIRFNAITDRAIESGLPIRVLQLRFPSAEAGLPEGCESMDTVPSQNLFKNFFEALEMLQQPLEQVFEELQPRPSCIIADKHLVWAADTAKKFGIPRISFDGMSCFTLLCTHNLHISKAHEGVPGSHDLFVVPGLPDHIEFTRAQLPGQFNPGAFNINDIRKRIREAETGALGVVVNSFEELEARYVSEYRKVNKVWCIGPLSLCNTQELDKAQRGNKASIDESQCLKWLDKWKPSSVVYACLGSLTNVAAPQLVELGLALEASNCPFIWVIRGGDRTKELEKWMKEGFEERTKGRGLLIRGWAPQVLILSHPAIGAFLTHCGWNSTLEGVCSGVPMITWPFFGEQFLNEKFVVEVLEIGVSVGAKAVVHVGEEHKCGVLVKREEIRKGVERVIGEGKEGEERRKKAKELGEMANRAIEEGGSSQLNITMLIQDIIQQAKNWSSC